MKIVTGLFSPKDINSTIAYLTDNGFTLEDISLITSASNIPEYLEGEPEESAAAGAAVGAVSGGALAALVTWVSSTIPGFESAMAAGLMTTAVGGVLGAYLGSIYTVRAAEQTSLNINEALADGKFLLIVKADEVNVETAVSLMANGEHIEVHTINETAEAALPQPTDTIDTKDPVDETGWGSFPASDPPPY
jgi:outer membrane lipoprotein SlyB